MTVLYSLQNCLRTGCEKDNPSVFLHLHYVLLSQGNAAAAGDHHIGPFLHFYKQAGLQVPEIFFSPCFKDVRNTHSLSLGDHLVHFYDFHVKQCMKILRNRRFSRTHKSDEHNIVGKQLSGLYLLTAFQDCLKNILYFLFVSVAFQLSLQPDPLPLFLVRLKHRHFIFLFIGHQLFHNLVSLQQSLQNVLIAGHQFFSVFF